MSNLTKLEFVALDISGKNYLSWILDAQIHLDAKNLGNTILEGNDASLQDRAKAMIFIRHHIHEELKTEYLTVKNPYILWKDLSERYEHKKTVILPRARYEWMHLRLQDYKQVTDYNSALFKISSQLKLCGEKITDVDMLEKTYSTFHASNMLLQQQYRQRGFTKYSELISCLLVAEQNNELLLKNHESRPTGSTPFPEANGTIYNGFKNKGHKNNHGRKNHWHRKGYNSSFKKSAPHHQKWNGEKKQDKRKSFSKEPKKQYENACFRCGMKGHWSRTCRTPKHLSELYQASQKDNGKKIESNFSNYDNGFTKNVNGDDPMDFTNLDVSDFFEDRIECIDDLIGNIHIN